MGRHTTARPARVVRVILVACLGLGACSGPEVRSTLGTSRSTPAPPAAPGASAQAGGASTSTPATQRMTTPPPGPEQRVATVLAGMTREQQVAQLFVVGVPLIHLEAADALVTETAAGGVFLAGRSQVPASELAATTRRWAAEAPGPRPWVAADQEGGEVQTLSGPGFRPLPAASTQGGLARGELAALTDGMGSSLRAAGVDLDLAPVADVVPAGTEHSNRPIGLFGRQYGSTADAVIAGAGTVVEGLSAHQVTATLKHFPGLGRVHGNTDDTAGVTDSTTTRDDAQVRAFGALAHSSARPLVMMSSATYTRIDPASPAVFSPAVLGGLLRQQLGYQGPVISDDLGTAVAVRNVPVGERAVRFLAAGGTLVLTVEAATLPAMMHAVLARDATDVGFSATVDAAVRLALLAKARAGLLGPS